MEVFDNFMDYIDFLTAYRILLIICTTFNKNFAVNNLTIRYAAIICGIIYIFRYILLTFHIIVCYIDFISQIQAGDYYETGKVFAKICKLTQRGTGCNNLYSSQLPPHDYTERCCQRGKPQQRVSVPFI